MTAPNLQLATTLLGSAHAPCTLVLLHGILGSAGNLRGLGRRLVAAIPAIRVALLDLRGHGASAAYARSAGGPHSVRACARDVELTLRAQSIEPSVIMGHSFGGKVALCYAQEFTAGDAGSVTRQIWALDSPPGDRGDPNAGEVGAVFRAVQSIAPPFESREAMLKQLTELGVADSIARWMTTNLKRSGSGYDWTFDLDVVRALLEDYFRVDMWPWLESRRGTPDIHLLRAERSDRLTDDDEQRALALPPQARVSLHRLANSGHWVHADNPDGLLEILVPALSADP